MTGDYDCESRSRTSSLNEAYHKALEGDTTWRGVHT